jgi:hypothetical protein
LTKTSTAHYPTDRSTSSYKYISEYNTATAATAANSVWTTLATAAAASN